MLLRNDFKRLSPVKPTQPLTKKEIHTASPTPWLGLQKAGPGLVVMNTIDAVPTSAGCFHALLVLAAAHKRTALVPSSSLLPPPLPPKKGSQGSYLGKQRRNNCGQTLRERPLWDVFHLGKERKGSHYKQATPRRAGGQGLHHGTTGLSASPRNNLCSPSEMSRKGHPCSWEPKDISARSQV